MNARLALAALLLAATAFASAAERDDTDTTVTNVGCGEERDCLLHYAPPLPRGDWVCNGSDPIFCGDSSWNVTDAGAVVADTPCGLNSDSDCWNDPDDTIGIGGWAAPSTDTIVCNSDCWNDSSESRSQRHR